MDDLDLALALAEAEEEEKKKRGASPAPAAPVEPAKPTLLDNISNVLYGKGIAESTKEVTPINFGLRALGALGLPARGLGALTGQGKVEDETTNVFKPVASALRNLGEKANINETKAPELLKTIVGGTTGTLGEIGAMAAEAVGDPLSYVGAAQAAKLLRPILAEEGARSAAFRAGEGAGNASTLGRFERGIPALEEKLGVRKTIPAAIDQTIKDALDKSIPEETVGKTAPAITPFVDPVDFSEVHSALRRGEEGPAIIPPAVFDLVSTPSVEEKIGKVGEIVRKGDESIKSLKKDLAYIPESKRAFEILTPTEIRVLAQPELPGEIKFAELVKRADAIRTGEHVAEGASPDAVMTPLDAIGAHGAAATDAIDAMRKSTGAELGKFDDKVEAITGGEAVVPTDAIKESMNNVLEHYTGKRFVKDEEGQYVLNTNPFSMSSLTPQQTADLEDIVRRTVEIPDAVPFSQIRAYEKSLNAGSGARKTTMYSPEYEAFDAAKMAAENSVRSTVKDFVEQAFDAEADNVSAAEYRNLRKIYGDLKEVKDYMSRRLGLGMDIIDEKGNPVTYTARGAGLARASVANNSDLLSKTMFAKIKGYTGIDLAKEAQKAVIAMKATGDDRAIGLVQAILAAKSPQDAVIGNVIGAATGNPALGSAAGKGLSAAKNVFKKPDLHVIADFVDKVQAKHNQPPLLLTGLTANDRVTLDPLALTAAAGGGVAGGIGGWNYDENAPVSQRALSALGGALLGSQATFGATPTGMRMTRQALGVDEGDIFRAVANDNTEYDLIRKAFNDAQKAYDDAVISGDPAKIAEAKAAAIQAGKLADSAFKEMQKRGATSNVKNQIKTNVDDYGMFHRPPDSESGAPAFDLTGEGRIYPDDVYSPNGKQYYGTGDNKSDSETFSVIHRVRGNPNAEVTIYRAIPKIETKEELLNKIKNDKYNYMKRGTIPKDFTGNKSDFYDWITSKEKSILEIPNNETELPKINIGDWVSLSKNYAKDHGESWLKGNYRIISKKVKSKDIYTNGDSINEFGYFPVVEK